MLKNLIVKYHQIKGDMSIKDSEKIKEFAKETSRLCEAIPTRINAGGCGFFAYYASLRLTKMKIPHSIVACGIGWNFDENWDKNLKLFNDEVVNNTDRNPNYYGLSCSHVMIKIGTWYMDSEGIHYPNKSGRIKDLFKEQGEYDLATLKWSIRSTNCWNDTFDRKYVASINAAIRTASEKFNINLTQKVSVSQQK
jgi:hypothetical protein